jgi:hypothetical protein
MRAMVCILHQTLFQDEVNDIVMRKTFDIHGGDGNILIERPEENLGDRDVKLSIILKLILKI